MRSTHSRWKNTSTPPAVSAVLFALVTLVAIGTAAPHASARQASDAAGDSATFDDRGQVMDDPVPGGGLNVSFFQIEYHEEYPFLDDLEALQEFIAATPVRIERDGALMDVASGGGTMPFGSITADGPVRLSRAGLETVIADLTASLDAELRRGWYFIAPSPDDIDPMTGQDVRPPGDDALTLRIAFDGSFIDVSRFELVHAREDVQAVFLEGLEASVTVPLVRTPDGYVTWRPGEPVELVSIESPGAGSAVPFSAGAIQEVAEAVRDAITDEGWIAVNVSPADGELGQTTDGAFVDLREGRETFRLRVLVAPVGEVRTVAGGRRNIPEGERYDHPAHRRILRDSPFQPAGPDGEGGDPINRNELDRFVYLKSRHPGRRVDAVTGTSELLEHVALDYQVLENKPLTLYAQAANTGTEQTDDWRYRFGLYHTQLTNNDDILALELSTAGWFEGTVGTTGSYEAPIGDTDRLRWRVYGDWSKYVASEVGFADARFEGDTWGVGGELQWNFYQDRELFLDLIGGVKYRNVRVENFFVFIEGEERFLFPYLGLALERQTGTAATDAFVALEYQARGVAESELVRLGRINPDDNWFALKWDLSHAFFLEPLLNPDGWRDITTPGSSTLAHEIALRFRGQYAFGNRLVPQFEQVVGGAYSVRGYPESVAVGDDAYVATAEYRFHLPQVLPLSDRPASFLGRPFRFAPQHPYGRADWDLILKGFVDVGRTSVSDALSFEDDENLLGAGIGIQLLYDRNLDIRLDWGFALEELEGRVDDGSSQVHFVATLLF